MEPLSTLPRVEANDQRSPAGQMVDGELQIELEAVESTWYPRGPDGPGVVTPAFAEVDGPPQVPGPLIRAPAGTPVHVTIHNRLDRSIAVRGLIDRASMASETGSPGGGPFPPFALAEPLVVPPGETRETRFTPTSEVSSFYYAHRVPPGSGAEDAPPFGTLQEGAFMGALVVDPADFAAQQDERVLMITRWNSFAEGPTQKVMANGLSWPFTERLEYTVGDTVQWRVINASNLDHPMHLHGFYFTVDALGDTQADTIYAPGARPVAVTQMMEEFSAMRLTWVPEQPGNWLFHCHLVRHMAFPQRFASEGELGPVAGEAHDGHRMDNMAGLITGITVDPAPGAETPEEAPVRRIDLWTGERPDVYDGDPELGFVVQEGTEPPAPDSTIVPGSPLVLTRGEPTEIVVHNRLDFPLSVHWHGLELRSVYDGVGGWSGYPGATRPPIPPGDSVRVLITPPRAGSFMYHIHGEPGHQLSQGLYGPFLVLEPGEERDADADRVYTLADRGATGDAAPAINGRTRPDPQRFQAGRTYRLRFLQISADAFKRVRLLRDGEPVHWLPLAKDGADLPEAARELGAAALAIGVGETFDVEWQPERPGVYVLEVTTEFFPALGGTVVQRVAFGVGDVAQSELLRAQELAVAIDMPSAERARYVGTFVGPQVVGGDEELVLSVWEEQERLYATLLMPVDWDDDGTPERLFPVGDGSLAPGRELDGLRHLFSERYRFREAADGGLDHLDAEFGGQVVAKLARVPHLELAEPRLRRFEGTYGTAGASGTAIVVLDDGLLTLVREGGPSERLVPISSTRFAVEGESGMRVDFELDDERAAGLTIVSPTGARTHLPAAASDTVHVTPPTGKKEIDRQSILSALESVPPGGTVQFAEGRYVLGEMVDVAVPRITLVGHPDGTTLRGCDPAVFEDREAAVAGCNGLSLVGGHQTLRGLTFEYTWLAVLLGGPQCNAQECSPGTLPIGSRAGGYMVEGNTFRQTPNGIRLVGQWTEPAVIRDNRFINTYHAVVVRGMTAHILDNRISVPDPGRVPTDYHPGLALMIGGWEEPGMPACDHNVIAGNRIHGHPDAIAIVLFPGGTCRQNVIRDNEIEMSPVRFTSPSPAIFVRSADDSTVAGVPIALLNGPLGKGIIEDNIIDGNRIIGAEGVAIEVLDASHNRIRNNTINGVSPRDPFPGNTLFPNVPEWGESNGSGIWVSPGSVDNEISGNSFEDIALHDVVLEGDRKSSGQPGVQPWPADLPLEDTVRYSAIVNGMPAGERLMWKERPDRWAYSYDIGESDFLRTELLVLDDDGLPLRMEISGQKNPWDSWEERFESGNGTARWTTTVDEGEWPADAPAYYAPLHPAHDPGVLARALLHRSSGRLPLLPEGEARLEKLGERTVEVDGSARTLRHYAVHGLDLKPAYVWLDSNGATFADEWTVRSGWESVFPELKAQTRAALAEHVKGLAGIMAPPQRDRSLVIRGARLFDPASSSVRPGTTILIEADRIVAVEPDDSLELPADAQVIDADGRTVLPGLWDMHAHHGTSLIEFFRYRELDAPLHLAGGVTTARDLGSHTDELLSLRRRIESGEAVGPRLLAAGYVDGIGGNQTGVQVGTPEQARAAVDRFAELGYAQIKIYGQLPDELVPVVIERADRHGLRVGGHLPRSMSGREAVEAGFDELQHVEIAVHGILGSLDDVGLRWTDDWEGWADAQVSLQPDSEPVREFINLLAAHDVAVDPTLALALAREVPPHYIAPVLDRFPAQARRRLLDRFWSRPPQAVERWDRYVSSWMGFVRAAHEAGVPVLPGTDLMPGFGLHRELELYVEAGIPAPEVLTLATLGAARVMGMDDELGSIEAGKLADLILVDGDPTTDISDIRRVMTVIKGGRVYDPAAIYGALGIEPCCEQ